VRYVLLIYADEDAWDGASEEERRGTHRGYVDYLNWLEDRGWSRGGDQFASSASATCVRVQGDRTVTTDGPFGDAKEQLGGFYLIECDNLDQAIDAASRVPAAGRGTIEVRPIAQAGS
jgi:hypothetical protein